tara:strand:- start:1699 stop:2379 length:681 start_codon:yes stop_codon:yes gene_type:complete
MDLNIVKNEDISVETKPTMEDKSMIDSLGSKPLQMVIDESPPSPQASQLSDEQEEDTIKVDPIDDKVIFGTDESEPEPVIKKVRSEKQREHLKKAREKALATRQAKAKVKKEEAEAKRLERESKREEAHKLKLLREDKEFETKKKIQESVPPAVTASQKQNKSFTEEDIMLIQQKAIDTYEKKRKAEKKIRKEEESKVNQEKMIHQKISRAIQQDPNDLIWGSCFN